MEVPLIITKLIINTIYFTDIKYYLILHYIKLGMTMIKHNVLKKNNKYIKNIKFINTLYVVKTIKLRVKSNKT